MNVFTKLTAQDKNMQQNHCTTVPRKRRPRAAGEVSITSHSSVYVNHSEVLTTDDGLDEPVYQNAVAAPLAPPRRKPGTSSANAPILPKRPDHFVVVAVSNNWAANRAIEFVENVSSETQYVTVFIGKPAHEFVLILDTQETFMDTHFDYIISCMRRSRTRVHLQTQPLYTVQG